MRKVSAVLLVMVFVLGLCATTYASDWDKAGKILTGIEGLRIITGGTVDIIGSLTGINRRNVVYASYQRPVYYERVEPCNYPRRVWVPHYVWRTKYIPPHEEYRDDCGYVFIEGHYVRYQVECGGHWEYVYD